MSLWPTLLRPGWLLLLPVAGWLLWRLWHREQRTGRWQRLLPPHFHALLLTRGRLRSSRWPWWLLGLAWLLALAALVGPSWQRLSRPDPQQGAPLVVILEVTPAMLAGDVGPDRLGLAKRKLLDLLRSRPDAPTAVVVYAGSAHTLVPLSDDLATTANLLDAVRPAIMPEPGQRPDLAVAQAIALLDQAGLGRGRLLLMASSLGQSAVADIAAPVKTHGLSLAILGLGTPEGAPIPLADGGLAKDARGAILLPRLDEATLRELAQATGGYYRRARSQNGDLAAIGLLDRGTGTVSRGDTRQFEAWQDQGYWLLLPLLLLAACAGRRGWLFVLAPLALLPAPPAQAFEWQDLWLRADQQGQRLLEQQRPAEAAQRFRDSQWRGLAAYLAGDYPAAAELFARRDTAAAHYNRGNALARSDQLQAALEAYDQALELQPELEPARHNRALVEQMLQQQREDQARPDTGQPTPDDQSQPRPSPAPGPAPGDADAPPTATTAPPKAATNGGQAGTPESSTADQQADGPAPMPATASDEQSQALEQWLRRIPDDPGELLRQKFLLEQRKRRESSP